MLEKTFDRWLVWYQDLVADYALSHDAPVPVLAPVYEATLAKSRAVQYDRVLDHWLDHLPLDQLKGAP